MPAVDENTQGDENTPGEPQVAGDEPSRPCRYCAGTMYLSERTDRPRVIEIMWMPWGWFQQARPGPIVTLGEHVPDAQAGERHDRLQKKPRRRLSREASPRPTSAFL